VAGEKQGGQRPDGVTLGVLIAMRQQVEGTLRLLDSLIGAHTPPEQGAQGGAAQGPPLTFGQRPSNGG
jgi:hypothetical protein